MTTPLPYTRALHPDDLHELAPYTNTFSELKQRLTGAEVRFREDHPCRVWEYGNVLRQLHELAVPRGATILDAGSGGSYLPLVLAMEGYAVTVADSMAYGDFVDELLVPQCLTLGVRIPVIREPVEAMGSIPGGAFDVTLCISVIEHVDVSQYAAALTELSRVTRPGGYVFLTSDYFETDAQWAASPYKQIQHTALTADRVALVEQAAPWDFVGGVDLTYRGDFVHNYSCINMALRRTV